MFLLAVLISHVLTGDSFRLVDGRDIHLRGVYAPLPGHGYCGGDEAAVYLREHLPEKLAVDLEDVYVDHYGITYAYIKLPDGTDLNQYVLANGYVKHRTISPHPRAKAYAKAEKAAKKAKLAIWSCK